MVSPVSAAAASAALPVSPDLHQLAAAARRQWGAKKPYRPSLALRLLFKLATNIRFGICHVILPDGGIHTLIGSADATQGEPAICVIKHDRLARIFLIRGMLGFCEAYLNGDWESPDMTSLFTFALRNQDDLARLIDGHEWSRRLRGWLNSFSRNTKRGSRRNIASHYDLGNEFYARWLDRSMTYSAALYDPASAANDRLFDAQQNKYRHIARMLDIQPQHRVLEIGCGWGGFAEWAAQEIGCHVTGLTISQAQHDYAVQRLAKAGLQAKTDIQMCDYRDSTGQFDRIVSIEMFEAVGEQYWPRFFDVLRERLRPGGRAALQVITIAERHFDIYRRGADYIQKYIFPGGLLPTFQHLREHVKETGLQWKDSLTFGADYAETLAAWRQKFLAVWPDIAPLGFDEKFRRMWEQYLCYCEAGFRDGMIDVCQISFTRPAEGEVGLKY